MNLKSLNKYKSKKIKYDGFTFDSKKEFSRYQELKILLKSGKINDLKIHPKFLLIEKNYIFRKCEYNADFSYIKGGEYIVEDVKGMKNGAAYNLFKIKQKLMYDKYKIKVIEI